MKIILAVLMVLIVNSGLVAQRSPRPERSAVDNNITTLQLPAFHLGSKLTIDPFDPARYARREVDRQFMQAHILNNDAMSPPTGDPIFTSRHFYWGYIQDASFGKNVLIAEISGVDVMEHVLYLLQFTDDGRLVSTLPVASFAGFSDTDVRLISMVREHRIDTSRRRDFLHHDVPAHLNPVVERSYVLGRSQGGTFSEIVTGNYYMPGPHGIGLASAMESEFFYAWETQPERPRMFIIGWSHGGCVAYITEYFEDGIGAVFYSWNIFDITVNRVVWTRRDSEEEALNRIYSSGATPRSAEAFMEFYQAGIESVAPVLQEFGIISQTESWFTPLFPRNWYEGGEAVTVQVTNENRSRHPDFGVQRLSSYSMEIHRGDRRRIFWEEQNMGGLILGVRPIGRIPFPYDPNKSVVVSGRVTRGWEGPPNRVEVQLNGVRTDF